jgi:hypothetical protein
MRKNIYIKDEDQELFKKAEALGGGNFSAMIAKAVRHFVKFEEAKEQGMEEVELEVGVYYSGTGFDDVKKVKFIGKKIADATICNGHTGSRDDQDQGTDYKLYLTKKGKFLLHRYFWIRRRRRRQGKDSESWYNLYDSMSQLMSSGDLPGDLIHEAREALGVNLAEYLDV